jgi:hypothetical protein
MKKTRLFIAFIFLVAAFMSIKLLIPGKHNKIVSSWSTYVRLDKNPEISMSYPTTILEMSLTQISEKRSPASNPISNGLVKINGRDLSGDGADEIKSEQQFLDLKDNYYFENEVSDTWEKNFANNQLRFQEADTRLMIKKDASVLQIKRNRVRYLEIITVNVIKNMKFSNSFNAMVDSQSGQLLNTWNMTVHENNNEMKRLKFPISE